MDTSDTDSRSASSDGSELDYIAKSEPENAESDLFVDSTISRDDTRGKDHKEKAMLESLADKLHSGCEFDLRSLPRPPIPGMQRAGLPPPPGMPVKVDRHAEWRQRTPHSKAHGGPSVEGSQEAQMVSSQPQRAAAEYKNGLEAIQSAGDDSRDNANDKHKHFGIIYEDEPRYGSKDPTGKVPIYNIHAYLAQHSSICFIVFKGHSCTVQKNNKDLDLDFMNPEPTASENLDRLRIISPLLQKALETVAQFRLKKENEVVEMSAPYNFLFHHRKRLTVLFEESDTYKAVLAPLLEFLDKNYKEEYESAEALFQRGMVSARHIGKLFKPNQMVLSKSQGTDGLKAFVLLDYPDRGRKGDSKRMGLRGWSWRYNGTELLRDEKMEIIDRPSDDETAITDLDVHPVEFAHQSDIEQLQRRGQKFWDHKAQVLVNYTGWDKIREHYYVGECSP
ncbi:hypothetical protein AUP68_10077 [Ilyonectria robusta]